MQHASPDWGLRYDRIACQVTSILVLLLTSHSVLDLLYSSRRLFSEDKCDLILIELWTRRHIVLIRPLVEVLSRGHLAELSSVIANRPARWYQSRGSLLLFNAWRLIILLPRIFRWTFEMTYRRLWNVVISGIWICPSWCVIVVNSPLLRCISVFRVFVRRLWCAFEQKLTLMNWDDSVYDVIEGIVLTIIFTQIIIICSVVKTVSFLKSHTDTALLSFFRSLAINFLLLIPRRGYLAHFDSSHTVFNFHCVVSRCIHSQNSLLRMICWKYFLTTVTWVPSWADRLSD